MEELARITDYLNLLGLSKDASKIYMALITHGAMTMSQLSTTSGVERTALYRMIDDLEQQRIVAIQQASKRKIISPSPLSHLVKDHLLKTERLKAYQQDFNELIDSRIGHASDTKVKFYHGLESIKQVIWNNLNRQAQDIYSSHQQPLETTIDSLFVKDYASKLKQKKITNHSTQATIDKSQYPNFKHYLIDPNNFKITKDLTVYTDTTIYYNWTKNYAVEVYDKNLSQTNRQFIQLLIKMHR